MTLRCFFVTGILAAGLSGCKAEAPKPSDSGVADGPKAAADGAADSPSLPGGDTGAAGDEPRAGGPQLSDGSVRDARADQTSATDFLIAKDLIATTDPIVINVHIPYEGDIPGTDTSIPYTDVDAIEDYLKHDHCADVLLVCRSDHMSQIAGDELVKRGYLRVRDLKGGFTAWQNAGYPLLKDGGT
jgi:rhodanese-related sulfurtransferase